MSSPTIEEMRARLNKAQGPGLEFLDDKFSTQWQAKFTALEEIIRSLDQVEEKRLPLDKNLSAKIRLNQIIEINHLLNEAEFLRNFFTCIQKINTQTLSYFGVGKGDNDDRMGLVNEVTAFLKECCIHAFALDDFIKTHTKNFSLATAFGQQKFKEAILSKVENWKPETTHRGFNPQEYPIARIMLNLFMLIPILGLGKLLLTGTYFFHDDFRRKARMQDCFEKLECIKNQPLTRLI